MRRALILLGLAGVFVVALSIGADEAAASPASDDVTELEVAATLDVADAEGRRIPRLRPIVRCARMIVAVRRACPCAGPDGEGWGEDGHAAYMECVKDKARELVEAGGPVACARLIVRRANRTKIGEPGFVCPGPGRLAADDEELVPSLTPWALRAPLRSRR